MRAQSDLTDRLVAELKAAEASDGDIRRRQSAALLVVSRQTTGYSWADRKFDLRVEDHLQSVDKMKRLVRLRRVYLYMNRGDLTMEKNDTATVNAEYNEALKLAPQLVEIPFWCVVTMANGGKVNEALPIFEIVFESERVWAYLIPQLVESELLSNDPVVIKNILAMAPLA